MCVTNRCFLRVLMLEGKKCPFMSVISTTFNGVLNFFFSIIIIYFIEFIRVFKKNSAVAAKK